MIIIDTLSLLPPGSGPRANPLLFGVSEGLMRLFPLPATNQPSDAVAVRTGPGLDTERAAVAAPLPALREA